VAAGLLVIVNLGALSLEPQLALGYSTGKGDESHVPGAKIRAAARAKGSAEGEGRSSRT